MLAYQSAAEHRYLLFGRRNLLVHLRFVYFELSERFFIFVDFFRKVFVFRMQFGYAFVDPGNAGTVVGNLLIDAPLFRHDPFRREEFGDKGGRGFHIIVERFFKFGDKLSRFKKRVGCFLHRFDAFVGGAGGRGCKIGKYVFASRRKNFQAGDDVVEPFFRVFHRSFGKARAF